MAAAGPGPEMTPLGYGHLRTSHADRERAIDVLKAAFAEGRLDQDEYTERVGQVQTSRTYGELAALTADLPVGPLGTLTLGSGAPLVPATIPAPPSRAARPVSGLAVAALLFGVASVALPGLVPASLVAVTLCVVALARIGSAGLRGGGLAIAGGALGILGAMSSMYLFMPSSPFH